MKNDSEIKVHKLLSEKKICVGWQSADRKDKFSVINRLAEIAVKNENFTEKQMAEIKKALTDRENSMSTGIGDGVAIPHASIDFIDKTFVSLCVNASGIDFKSIDYRPAHIIFLILSPKRHTKAHLQTLAAITRILHSQEFRKRLIKCKTENEVYSAIAEQEAE